jgi:hypothetical protein
MSELSSQVASVTGVAATCTHQPLVGGYCKIHFVDVSGFVAWHYGDVI